MSMVPWPWPLAPLVLLAPIGLAAIVLRLVYTHVVLGGEGVWQPYFREQRPALRVPLFPTFRSEVLPALGVLWLLLLAGWSITSAPVFWALLPWATVTVIMLWPVARELDIDYLTYRSWLFILGVLSMGYIILTGIALEAPLAYEAKLLIFLALPFDLTVFGILPALRQAIGRPLPMFFRPDLIFGDGRVLATGTLSLILGLRYLLGAPPPADVPVPIPVWNWWAILWAIALGFIPLIAIRGILKLLLRLRRIRDGLWDGWTSTALRELLLVAAVVNIAFGFHNAFLGTAPFVDSRTVFHEFSWVPLLGIVAGTAFLIFVRGGFKRYVGEPFIRETLAETYAKEILYVTGVAVVAWSFLSLIGPGAMDVQHAGYRALTPMEPAAAPPGPMAPATLLPASGFVLGGMRGLVLGAWNWVGVVLVAWGLVMLIPFRVLAQYEQKRAIVAQLAGEILPTFTPEERDRVLRKMLVHLSWMSLRRCGRYVHAMVEGLDAAPAEIRALIARERTRILAELEPAQRDYLMECMARGLSKATEQQRVRAMSDMMAAVADLPEEARRAMMAKMSTLLA